MLSTLRKVAIALVGTCVCLLFGVALTLALSPFWRWMQAATGLRVFGHSGPPPWCYLLCSVPFFVAFGFLVRDMSRRRKRSRNPALG